MYPKNLSNNEIILNGKAIHYSYPLKMYPTNLSNNESKVDLPSTVGLSPLILVMMIQNTINWKILNSNKH